ncbi:MAG: helix-turn-helix domain-containing protein [Deltaproteobacteria bacterium]|nr:helix-turn-helix domain-containing protein [Deltaproteobacteria bacterium]
MSELKPDSPTLLFAELLMAAIRQAVREELRAANNSHVPDRLLEIEEAAKLLAVSVDWLYHNRKKLPFTRKIGPKMLRFSYAGMLRWMEAKKFS